MRLFTIASSPFFTIGDKTSQLMLNVLIALLPGIWAQWYYFGWGNLIQIILAMGVALSTEAIILKLRRRPILRTLSDNSALVTACLLGISIPGYAPWWIIVIGCIFAIGIAKHLYGGLGHNLFNPAMIGYVVLLISFPIQMTDWSAPVTFAAQVPDLSQALSLIFTGAAHGINDISQIIDGTTMATPLDFIKTQLTLGQTNQEILSSPQFNGFAGEGWGWINLGFAIGGLYLLSRRVISYHLCLSFLASLIFCSSLGYLVDPDSYSTPMMHLFSGGTMLAAFFIVTDPVSGATSNRGRIYYGFLIGFLVYLVRTWGNYPDAIAFSVLLANLAAPMIDKLTQPRTYGHQLNKVENNRRLIAEEQSKENTDEL